MAVISITELLGSDPKLRAAFALLEAWRRIEDHDARTKGRAVATAEFEGMCKMLDRLDLAHTPTEVHMAVLEAVREAPKKPEHRFAGSNEDYYRWQDAVCRDIAKRLGWEVTHGG